MNSYINNLIKYNARLDIKSIINKNAGAGL